MCYWGLLIVENGKSRKDRILAVVRRVKAQEPEIREVAKALARELIQKARELEGEKGAVTSGMASSAGHDMR